MELRHQEQSAAVMVRASAVHVMTITRSLGRQRNVQPSPAPATIPMGLGQHLQTVPMMATRNVEDAILDIATSQAPTRQGLLPATTSTPERWQTRRGAVSSMRPQLTIAISTG